MSLLLGALMTRNEHNYSLQFLLGKYRKDWKNEYAKASILKSGRVVFNICGKKYRLIVDINYERQWVLIRFIGTHTEYDKVDAEKI